MPKAQPDHWYGSFAHGVDGNTCIRCGVLRRPVRHPNGTATSFTEWSADGGKTWTRRHTACPMRKIMADEPKKEEAYPNCEKLRAAHKDKVIVNAFMEWLEEKKYVLAERLTRSSGYLGEELVPAAKSLDKLWLEYIEVDAQKLDDERRAILDEQRKLSEISKAGQEPPCPDCD
jgi:hypothetical protein